LPTARGGLHDTPAVGPRRAGRRPGRAPTTTTIIDGTEIAERIRADVTDCVRTVADEGVTPGVATVSMSADAASETSVTMKRDACDDLGIESYHYVIDAEAPAERLIHRVAELDAAPDGNGILVQMPVPDHVDSCRVLRRIDPVKDVDGFHPENVGRLVAGNARYTPYTPHDIQQLLERRRTPSRPCRAASARSLSRCCCTTR
jgi:methylenetetrahydrofolate dehydrogenase (NADP+)/methenyltetrahydrofolate cyclohydrolase